jgi:hypothetical protein
MVTTSAGWRSPEGEGLAPSDPLAMVMSVDDQSDQSKSAAGDAELSMVPFWIGSAMVIPASDVSRSVSLSMGDAWRWLCPSPRYDLLPQVRTPEIMAMRGGVV